MLFSIIKVRGHSLFPVYQDGDFVFATGLPLALRGIQAGDRVIFHHPVYGQLIKRVERVDADGLRLFVIGENDFSIDSRLFGPIPRDWVRAKVFWHISPR